MNVTIIYGSTGKTNTYNCVQLLLNNLRLNVNVKVKEFFLTKDYFYDGYFSYLKKGKKTYNNINNIDYIIKSLNNSNLIILASPVFTCDISPEMKMLLDKLSYRCMVNNQNSLMHDKIGLALSITAGAGLFHVTKILKKNLILWGINNTFKFSEVLYEINWDDLSLKTKKQIHKKVFKLSYKILDLYSNPHIIKSPNFNKIGLPKIKPVLRKNNYNVIDFNCWRKQTYTNGRHIL